ncbi:cysteine hydrolase family protein [Marinobacterium arenosum]|uniref:cysteine hydrolase family protein n=1 Tax=Marinobacterium arenosum TaxID=2862496 RepID=UPI001C985046|nr:cysteine hydrolase family protein [Marinobacterium arenosum]MBY4678960.1 cysteine hydrolase [Marinobacterium arenosum]
MANTALLLIDYQNDYFPGGLWPLVGIEQASAQGAKLLAAFRAAGWPVIHVRHEFQSEEAPFFRPVSEGALIHPSVAPQDGEPVILKHFANSFRDTALKAVLDRLDVDSLWVIGAMSHMCIDAGVRAATDLGYQCSVAEDACATRDQTFDGRTVPAQQVHDAYMAALQSSYARVTRTEELLAELNAG